MEPNDVILLVIIPSAQAPEIASSQVVRIAKEFYRDGNWLRYFISFYDNLWVHFGFITKMY